jgi:hypothetical protein
MRALVLLAVLSLAQNCTVSPAPWTPAPGTPATTASDAAVETSAGGKVEMRALAANSYAAATEKSAQFARDAAAYQRLWDQLIGSGTPPAVDFTTESVVFVMAGQKRSGGYSVTVNGVALDGDSLLIDATVQSPPPNAIVSMALTSPYAVVAVKNGTFESVLWP